jgi:propionate CoA-transferase
LLRLADAGQCELQCLPQGVMAFLIEAQGHGGNSMVTSTALGTFIDPRVGPGTPIAPPDAEQWVTVEDDQLCFRLPKVTVAVFNAPAADREGNLYIRNCAMIAESYEIAKAARANNGLIIANVARVVEKGHDEIFLPADAVDAVVVYPGTEQVGSIKHRKYWPMFTTHSNVPFEEGVAQLKFANQLLGITPRRSEVDNALARLAAAIFAENVRKGSLVNIGIGLPEEVCRLICEAGLFDDVTFFTESGVLGGLPAPGVFFGAAVCPREIMSSARIFHLCYERLDASILGMLQVDSEGNVNVSKRGEGAINYVGPGGFIDFSTVARTVIFVSSWMVHGKMRLKDGRLEIVERGNPKFIDQVDEITFSGRRALNSGRKIFYVSNVGAFQLTARGLELIRVAPGINIQTDILDFAPMKIVLPESGNVPVVDFSVMTGKGYRLHLQEQSS